MHLLAELQGSGLHLHRATCILNFADQRHLVERKELPEIIEQFDLTQSRAAKS
jgi:hypothetical protein